MSLISNFPNVPNTPSFGLFRAGYIYTLVCPYTEQVRYVGKTFSTSKRFYEHLNPSDRDKSRRANWIRSVISKGKLPIIQIIDDCDDFNWEEKEIGYIKLYKSIGARLTNHTDGGEDGGMYYKHTKEARAKISESLKKRVLPKDFGRKMSAMLIEKYKNDGEYRERAIKASTKNLANLTEEQKAKAIKNRRFSQAKRSKHTFCKMIKVNNMIKSGSTAKQACEFFNCNVGGHLKMVKKHDVYINLLTKERLAKRAMMASIKRSKQVSKESAKEIYEMSISTKLAKGRQEDLAKKLGMHRVTLRKIIKNYILNNHE